MIEFLTEPAITGTYSDNRPKYNVEVPLKGEPLIPVIFSTSDPSVVILEMTTRMNRFNTEDKSQKYDPSVWMNVGYYIHPPTIPKPALPKQYIGEPADPEVGQPIANPDFGKITAYYQVKHPGYYEPSQTWSNWPFRDPKKYDKQ